jgi:hypothetical protein
MMVEAHAIADIAELEGDVVGTERVQKSRLDGLAIFGVADGALARVPLEIDGLMRLGDRIVAHNGELDNMRAGIRE